MTRHTHLPVDCRWRSTYLRECVDSVATRASILVQVSTWVGGKRGYADGPPAGAIQIRRVWSFRHHAPEKYWRFPFKFPKRGTDISKRIVSVVLWGRRALAVELSCDRGFSQPAAAQFDNPAGLAISPPGDAIIVCDRGNNCVRRIDIATGAVVTIAGALESPGLCRFYSRVLLCARWWARQLW